MRESLKKGLCFGLTSGVITTLGMMMGLYSGTGSKIVVIGGILSIAIADSFSDALGIHVSEESNKKNTHKQVWATTFATFLAKFIFSMTFMLPILLLELKAAIILSVIWGFLILIVSNYYIAKHTKKNPFNVISEHLIIAIIVIILTHYAGKLINHYFAI